MNVPNFIVHAAGSVGNRAEPEKRAYRLRFCVTGHPWMNAEQLRRALNGCLDEVERQMRQRKFVFAGEDTIRFVRKQPHIEPMNIHLYRPPTSRQMRAAVKQGKRFRAPEETLATSYPTFEDAPAWDYLFSALFVHDTLLADTPDAHEVARR